MLNSVDSLYVSGIRSILLFGIPDKKDEEASSAWSSQGIVQKALKEIKKRFSDMLVITDVCLCAYMSHGHCGVIDEKGQVDNDPSLKILADVALSHAEAGSDMVAPSDMMDGRILSIRKRLDEQGLENLPILSYAAKYASAFYGPFRDAAHCAPELAKISSGVRPPEDRKSYQMDPANSNEALREIAQDIHEGADAVMVKPALAYLDIIYRASTEFNIPIAAYAVSGEYSMIKAAAEKGILDERRTVIEVMTSLSRAGANILISYHAKQISEWSKDTEIPISKEVIYTS